MTVNEFDSTIAQVVGELDKHCLNRIKACEKQHYDSGNFLISNSRLFHNKVLISPIVNNTGNPADISPSNGTEGVVVCQDTYQVVSELFHEQFDGDILNCRLIRLEPNACVWEHRDFQHQKKTQIRRVNIPIVTNKNTAFVSNGFRLHLAEGYIWSIQPKHNSHGVYNFGGSPRTHMLIDFVPGSEAPPEKKPADFSNSNVWEKLPSLSIEELNLESKTLGAVGDIESQSTFLKEQLLKLYYHYNLNGISSYQLAKSELKKLGLLGALEELIEIEKLAF